MRFLWAQKAGLGNANNKKNNSNNDDDGDDHDDGGGDDDDGGDNNTHEDNNYDNNHSNNNNNNLDNNDDNNEGWARVDGHKLAPSWLQVGANLGANWPRAGSQIDPGRRCQRMATTFGESRPPPKLATSWAMLAPSWGVINWSSGS